MTGISAAIEFPALAGRVKSSVENRTTEESLIRRVQARDEIAFHEMVDRYQNKVFSIIYGILRNRNDAEDIAQQVFAKIYFSIQSFDSRSSLLTWIYRITVNECYDYLRKRRARRLVYESDCSAEEVQNLEGSEAMVDSAAPVDRQLAERDLVMKLLAKIPEQARSLLVMKEVEGYSVEELVAITGLNENTIKVKLYRTRQKLVQAARRLGKLDVLRLHASQPGAAKA